MSLLHLPLEEIKKNIHILSFEILNIFLSYFCPLLYFQCPNIIFRCISNLVVFEFLFICLFLFTFLNITSDVKMLDPYIKPIMIEKWTTCVWKWNKRSKEMGGRRSVPDFTHRGNLHFSSMFSPLFTYKFSNISCNLNFLTWIFFADVRKV